MVYGSPGSDFKQSVGQSCWLSTTEDFEIMLIVRILITMIASMVNRTTAKIMKAILLTRTATITVILMIKHTIILPRPS